MEKLLDYRMAFNGESMKVKLIKRLYPNGRLAIAAVCPLIIDGEDCGWEPAFTATVNLVDETCPEGEVWVKDYSENEGMLDWLVCNGIVEPAATAWARSGYVGVTRHKLKAGWEEKLSDE
jgi:hypothetical protein